MRHGLDQGVEHLVDGVLDEHAGVVGNVGLQPLGQLAADVIHRCAHGLGHGQRVGAGRLLDADEDGRLALVPGGGLVVLGAQLQAGHITQAHQGVAAVAHHQVAEILLGDVGGGDRSMATYSPRAWPMPDR